MNVSENLKHNQHDTHEYIAITMTLQINTPFNFIYKQKIHFKFYSITNV
jgi:hypothetical protein